MSGLLCRTFGHLGLFHQVGQRDRPLRMGLGPPGNLPGGRDQRNGRDPEKPQRVEPSEADLAELRYVTKIKEAEHNSEFGFNKLDLGLSDLASKVFGGLTTLGAGFSTVVLVAGGIFLYCYCRRRGPPSGYAAPQVILPQAVIPQVAPAPAPAQPVYQPPSQSTYQAPSSAGHVYQYISPRRPRHGGQGPG